ncbi:hypothetical protein MMC09_005462 [Bachmanniomyces sp. S44760]|nr:hypothetical protein [Bachmanniomyces sp. S44760]
MSKPFSRRRDNYLISNDTSLLDHQAINLALGSDAMHWCSSLPEEELRLCLENSLCLGLYKQTSSGESSAMATPPRPTQIGLARIITDYVTFAYLTDVYVVPEFQHRGLSTWLIESVGEIWRSMPHLRGAHLFAAGEKYEKYYEKTLGMTRQKQGTEANGLVFMGVKGAGSVH